MKQPKTIALLNQKGGVNKTTAAIILATYLSKKGFKVGFVGADAQLHATGTLLNDEYVEYGLYDLISGFKTFDDVIVRINENLDFIPETLMLSTADILLSQKMGGEMYLAQLFDDMFSGEDYDYIIFDCPPAINKITSGIILYAQYFIIPVSPSKYSQKGLEILLEYLANVFTISKKEQKKFFRVLKTFHNPGEIASQKISRYLDEKRFNMFNTYISKATEFDTLTFTNDVIIEAKPNHPVAKEYLLLMDEILDWINQNY